jgi:putative transposase
MQQGQKTSAAGRYLGLPMSVDVTPADLHDTHGARRLLAGLKYFVPRLKNIWPDAAYRGQALADWCHAQGDWDLELVQRRPGVRGLSVQSHRWIVERSFAWLNRNRR